MPVTATATPLRLRLHSVAARAGGVMAHRKKGIIYSMEHMKEVLIVLTLLSALSAGVLLWLIRDPKTPKILDFIVGVQLIMFAAFFLGLLGDLRGLLPNGSEIKAGYDVAILIIPFFTAGLGTNILSNLVLGERDYNGTMTTVEISHKLFHCLIILVGVVVPPVLLGYAIWLRRRVVP